MTGMREVSGSARQPDGRPHARRIGARTTSSLKLACLPLAHVVALLLSSFATGGVTWVMIGVTGACAVLAAYCYATLDREQLGRRGHSRLPAAEWALVAPVAYLVLRARSTHSDSWDGLTPMWVGIGNLAAIPLVLLVLQLWGAAAVKLGMLAG